MFEWLNAATGWGLTPDEYMFIGRRVFTMRHLFNIKQGLDPWFSRPHGRMVGEPPLKVGKNAGKTVPIDAMMKMTWKNAGFDYETGIPLEETVEMLGLNRLLNAPDSEFCEEVAVYG